MQRRLAHKQRLNVRTHWHLFCTLFENRREDRRVEFLRRFEKPQLKVCRSSYFSVVPFMSPMPYLGLEFKLFLYLYGLFRNSMTSSKALKPQTFSYCGFSYLLCVCNIFFPHAKYGRFENVCVSPESYYFCNRLYPKLATR